MEVELTGRRTNADGCVVIDGGVETNLGVNIGASGSKAADGVVVDRSAVVDVGLQPAEWYFRHSELQPQAIEEEPVVDGVESCRQVEADQDSDLLVIGRREDSVSIWVRYIWFGNVGLSPDQGL